MKRLEKCCNMCGKKMKDSGHNREDYIVIEKQWGYFSNKDGEKHTIILCEDCYDMWTNSFKNPPIVEDVTEILSY